MKNLDVDVSADGIVLSASVTVNSEENMNVDASLDCIVPERVILVILLWFCKRIP
jgi:hypothetical protein